MQPMGKRDSCLPGCLLLLWLSVLSDGSMACPKPCACYAQTEVHCTFRYLNVIPKQIQSNVERINLGYNSLSKLTESDFSGLRKLELLMLHSNEIQTIHESAFQDLSSLQVLKMSYNKVKTLHKNTFSGLKNMIRLHMDHNKLEFLPPELFYGLTSLKMVHFEGNALRQLHADTFVTLRYIQIFKTSSIRHIYLSDNQLTSLPKEMFLYLNDLEGLYLYGNYWSCDCDMEWIKELGQKSRDLIKCKRDRSGQQCPLCFSPQKNKGKSIAEISSEELVCVKPTIDNIFKVKNVTTPEESSFTAISVKDFVVPIGSLILNMTDQSGNEANLECSVQRPTNLSEILLDRKEDYTIMRTTFSSFLVCNIDYDYIQKLWGILAMYSDSPMKLKRDLLLTKTPFISYKYKQVGIGDDTFTDIETELRAEPNWLMQDFLTLQLDRTATTLSTLHVRYLTDIYVTIPYSVDNPTKSSWVMIHKSNQTQTEYAAVIGGTLEMTCQAVGDTVPKIDWILPDGTKIRAPYMSKEGRITLTEDGKFILKAADSFDSGIYHCIATNDVDADVLTFRITVLTSDVDKESINGAEVLVNSGEVLQLPCGSKAVPEASVSWILPDHSILHSTSRNKFILSNGTLKIQDISPTDQGHFRCLVANKYGIDTITHKVLVTDRKINVLNKKIKLEQMEDRLGEGSGNDDLIENSQSVKGKGIGQKRFPNIHLDTKAGGQGNGKTMVSRRNRINSRLRGQRRQFSQTTRRIDPQRWTEILEKTKQNSLNIKMNIQATKSSAKDDNEVERVSGEAEEPSGEELLPVDENFLIITEKYSSVTMLNATTIMPGVTDSYTALWTTKEISATPAENNILEMPVDSPEFTSPESFTTEASLRYSEILPHTTVKNRDKLTTLINLNTSVGAIPEPPSHTGVQYVNYTDVTTHSMLKSSHFPTSDGLKPYSNDFTTAFKSLTVTPQIIITSPPASRQENIATSPDEFHYTDENFITNPTIIEKAQIYIDKHVTTSDFLKSLPEDFIHKSPSEISSNSAANIITNPTTTTSYDFTTKQNVFSQQPTTSSSLDTGYLNILSKPHPLEDLMPTSMITSTEYPQFYEAMEVTTRPMLTHKDITSTTTAPNHSITMGISLSTPDTKIKITQPTIASTKKNITDSYVLSTLPSLSTSNSVYGSENFLDSENKLPTQTKFQAPKNPQYSVTRDAVEENVVSIDSSTKSSTKLFHSQTDIGPIYIHSTQKIISPGLPAGSTIITHQQIQILKDVTPLVPLLRRYGRRRFNGRRRINRPDRIPNIGAHQFKAGRQDKTESTTAQNMVSEISKQVVYSTISSSTHVPLFTERSTVTTVENISIKDTTLHVPTWFKNINNPEIATNKYVTSSHSVDMSASQKIQVGMKEIQNMTTYTTYNPTGILEKEDLIKSTTSQTTTKPRPASKIIRRKIPWHRLFANNQIKQSEIFKKLRNNIKLTSTLTTPIATNKSTTSKMSTQTTDRNSKEIPTIPLETAEKTIDSKSKSATVTFSTTAEPPSTTVYTTSTKLPTTEIHLTSANAISTAVYPERNKVTAITTTATTADHTSSNAPKPIAEYPKTVKETTTQTHAIKATHPSSTTATMTPVYSANTIAAASSERFRLIPTKSSISTTPIYATTNSIARHKFIKRKRPRKKPSTYANIPSKSPEQITKSHTMTPTHSENDIHVTTVKKHLWDNKSKIPIMSLKPSPKFIATDTLTTPYLETSDSRYIASSDQAINRNNDFKHSIVTTHKPKQFSSYKTDTTTRTPSSLSVTAKIISSVTEPFPMMSPSTTKPSVSSRNSMENKPDPKASQKNVHIIAHSPSVLKKPAQYDLSSTTKAISGQTEEIPYNNIPSKPRIVGGRAASFTVLANTDAFIPCEATGNPTPTILWTKVSSGTFVSKAKRGNKMEVFTNGTLSIASVNVQDRGQYLCVANNQYGSDRLLVTLSVITYPPRIIQGKSKEITIHSGSNVNVKCQAEGRPFPTITWILANETIASEKSDTNHKAFVQPDGTLTIREVTLYDRGIYKCLATNIAGADTFTVRIQVIAAPPTILEDKRQTVVTDSGQNVKIHCTAKGNPPPNVHWVAFDGTKVKPLHYVNTKLFLFSNGTLYIRNVDSTDSGNYECIATSSTGSERRVVSLRVEQTDTIPKIILASPKSTEINFGDQLMLNCSATGEPKPKIIWRLPSKAVVDQWHRMGNRIQVYPNGSLIVQTVNEKDAGDYLCVARNKMGDDVILIKVSMTMKPAKIVHKQHLTKQVPYGKDFKVDCKALGSPLPEISWSLPDGTMINNVLQADDSGRRTRRYVLFDNGTLYLNKVGMSEEGDYTCYAENTLGKDEMKVHISIVKAAPRIKLNHMTTFQARAGSSAVLDCEAIGEPKPKIFWLLPSSDMIAVSHDRYILHDNGSLSITQVKLLDAGEYMCVARNPAGDDTRLLKLDVQSTPPVINGLYTNKTTIKDSALKHSRKLIHCNAEGTHPLQIMWIMPDNIYLTAPYHGSRITIHKNGTLEIRNVRPTDTAEFTCVARNDGGESMLIVQLEVLEVLRRPMFKNPFNEKIIAKPGKMAILNCFADGIPPPEIIWLLPNGTRFINGQRFAKYYAGTNGTFLIYSPSKDDAGKYRCAARNKVGYIEKLIILEVGQKPNIFTHPRGPIKNTIGEILSLHCLADGIPKPSVTWTLPSGFVVDKPHVNGKYQLLENGTLVIQETTIHDRGNYLCNVKNNAGEAAISVPVMIIAYPPRITNKPPQNIHTRAGSPVHFNCMAIGIPKPEITWELPDSSVLATAGKGRPMGTELLHPQGTLVIQNPKNSDSGMYKCIAKNPIGTDISLTYLKVI